MFLNKSETFFLHGKQILLPRQMFPGAAKEETFASATSKLRHGPQPGPKLSYKKVRAAD